MHIRSQSRCSSSITRSEVPATWSSFAGNSTLLWEAWNLATTYRCRPSDLYGIHDEVTAWCFDRAVYTFGSGLRDALKSATHSAKSNAQAQARYRQTLAKWLGGPVRYRDPVASGSGVVSSEKAGPVSL